MPILPIPARIVIGCTTRDSKWLEMMRHYLQPLVKQGLIKVWDQDSILAGADKEKELRCALEQARFVVLLVSQYLMGSDLYDALEKYGVDRFTIFLIFVGRVTIEDTFLARLKPINPEDRSLNRLSKSEQEEVFLSLFSALRSQLTLNARSPNQPSHARVDLSTFRLDFATVQQKMILLRDYKAIHDQLHNLQFQVYNPIADEAAYFPGDPRSRRIIEKYAMGLNTINAQLRHIVSNTAFAESEVSWIGKLDVAEASLKGALAQRASEPLAHAMEILQGILSRMPAKYNILLCKVAAEIRIEGLTRKESLPFINAELSSAIEEMTALNQKLPKQVEEHDRWQELDSFLTLYEVIIVHDVRPLRGALAQLREHLSTLGNGPSEGGAPSLEQHLGTVEASLSGDDTSVIKESFMALRSTAGTSFYRIDLELKGLCERLVKSAERLHDALQPYGEAAVHE